MFTVQLADVMLLTGYAAGVFPQEDGAGTRPARQGAPLPAPTNIRFASSKWQRIILETDHARLDMNSEPPVCPPSPLSTKFSPVSSDHSRTESSPVVTASTPCRQQIITDFIKHVYVSCDLACPADGAVSTAGAQLHLTRLHQAPVRLNSTNSVIVDKQDRVFSCAATPHVIMFFMYVPLDPVKMKGMC